MLPGATNVHALRERPVAAQYATIQSALVAHDVVDPGLNLVGDLVQVPQALQRALQLRRLRSQTGPSIRDIITQCSDAAIMLVQDLICVNTQQSDICCSCHGRGPAAAPACIYTRGTRCRQPHTRVAPRMTDDTSGFDAAHATASWGSVQPSSVASGCSASTFASFSSVMSPAMNGCHTGTVHVTAPCGQQPGCSAEGLRSVPSCSSAVEHL